MRRDGVAVPKYNLKNQIRMSGELSIQDGRDEGLFRVIKTARLVHVDFNENRTEILYEPHIVWMNEGRFTLQGFERVYKNGEIVEYAQSWLCSIEP
jgi:hypothetical protein